MFALQGNHPALQLLRKRAAQNSLPNDRRDKFKLGLVVEGGGMRGAVSAGALLELGNLGFRCDCMLVQGKTFKVLSSLNFSQSFMLLMTWSRALKMSRSCTQLWDNASNT